MRRLQDADFRPLTAPVTIAGVRAFRRDRLRAQRGSTGARRRGRDIAFAAAAVAVIVAVCVFVSARLAFDAGTAASAGGPQRARAIASGILVLLVAAIVVAGIALARREYRVWRRRLRVDAFCRVNGFAFAAEPPVPHHPGTLFQGGERAWGRDRLRTLDEPMIEAGTYEYTARFGRSVSRRVWGYLAIRSGAELPRFVLEARSHRGALSTTGVPAAYRALPAKAVVGEQGEPFTLYSEHYSDVYSGGFGAGEHADGILTPTLIDLLGSADAVLDVETADEWLFLYTPAGWDLADPALLRRLFPIADAIIEMLPMTGRQSSI